MVPVSLLPCKYLPVLREAFLSAPHINLPYANSAFFPHPKASSTAQIKLSLTPQPTQNSAFSEPQ